MRAFLLASVVFLLGCPKPLPPGPPPPPPPENPTCADACMRFDALGCPEGEPTAEGASCLDVCRGVEEGGFLRWDLACLTQIRTCAEIPKCPATPTSP